jgi:hypothetical protein
MSISGLQKEKKGKYAYFTLVVVGMKKKADNGAKFEDFNFDVFKDEDLKKEAESYMKEYIRIKNIKGFEI